MSNRTIETVRVARSVGLPGGSWECRSALVPGCSGVVVASRGDLCDVAWRGPEDIEAWDVQRDVPVCELLMVLREQTAFGVALRLDEWERARDLAWDKHTRSWATRISFMAWKPKKWGVGLLAHMIARLTQIFYDHEIRRALRWLPPLPDSLTGHLEDLRLHHRGYWIMGLGSGRTATFGLANEGRWQPLVDYPGDYLVGVGDADEALAAIHAEVCGGLSTRAATG